MICARNIDATKGPLYKSFIIYALPLAIGSIIQTFFNAADMMVLGNLSSSTAVASVGATTTIISLLVHSFIGLSGGTQVVLSHAYGANNRDTIKKTVSTSIILSVILGMTIAIIGSICAEWFLNITKCPADCFDGAALYMRIYFASVPAIMIYNFGAAIIRVSGDTQRPLYYLIACGVVNVLLNIVLCLIMTQKTAAVAIATLASQVLGAILVVIRLVVLKSDFHLNVRALCFDISVLKKILFIGIPNALNASLYSISNLQIQSAINSFGSPATAGNTAATHIEGFISSFVSAVNTTALTFISQNVGAHNKSRIKKTIIFALICGICCGFFLGMGAFLIGKPLLSLFLGNDTVAIECGYIRMKYILTMFAVNAISGVFSSALQSFGYAIMPMLNSIFSVFLFRVVWMLFVYPHFLTLDALYFCYLVSWSLVTIIASVLFVIIIPKKIKALREPCNENTDTVTQR